MAALDIEDVKLEETKAPAALPDPVPLQRAGSAPGPKETTPLAAAGKSYDPDMGPPGLQARSLSSPGRLVRGSTQSSRQRRQRAGRSWVAALAATRLKGILSPPAEEFMCPLCLCNEDVEQSYTVEPCGHQCCKDCLSEYLTAEVSEAHVRGIKCPCESDDGTDCSTVIGTADIRQVVPEDVFSKYERFLATQTDTTLRACPQCKKLNSGNPHSPKIMCSCGQEYCYFHSNAHVGTTCSAYRQKKVQETRLNDKFISKHTVVCPKPTCGLPVTKSSGCNHMTCSRCRSEFCYLCGSPVLFGGSLHFMKFNWLGCPDMQFSGHEANHRKRPWCWRVCILPICALISLALVSPLLAIAAGVWAAGFGVCFLCIVAYVINACIKDRLGDEIVFMCCFWVGLGASLAACCEPWLVPLSEFGRCCTLVFGRCCGCCRRRH